MALIMLSNLILTNLLEFLISVSSLSSFNMPITLCIITYAIIKIQRIEYFNKAICDSVNQKKKISIKG
jgi:hypothetical protein